MNQRTYQYIKRTIDIAISITVLLVFSPFGFIIALILKFTGEGEIFYVQKRIGYHGRSFGLIKFATMLKDSLYIGTGSITLENDPRVLPFGKFLRKTKLNEIPQLLNVLIGDMSIVGPRPLVEPDFRCYAESVQRKIVTVRPGLTGIGSLVFRNEENIISRSNKKPRKAYEEDVAPYKGALELWYIENSSTLLDLKIIFLTSLVVLFPNNQLHEKLLDGIPDRESQEHLKPQYN